MTTVKPTLPRPRDKKAKPGPKGYTDTGMALAFCRAHRWMRNNKGADPAKAPGHIRQKMGLGAP